MSAEPDYLPADALAEEEPKYLRRQKPVEIRKRKFSRKTWPLYRRIMAGGIAVMAAGFVIYQGSRYFLFSEGVMLERPDQIDVIGSRFVGPEAIAEKFSADMGRSVVRVPLEERRKSLESIAWIERAAVQRVMPNRLRVEVVERTPVAFLRSAGELSLIDHYGVILERPMEGTFRFPVIGGIGESVPRDVREQRMKLFVQFMKEIEVARPGAADHISEADLSDGSDVRATVTGLGAAPSASSPILVHFGDFDFANRYHLLADNVEQWRTSAGRVDSVDLRFARQVVVNPEDQMVAAAIPPVTSKVGSAAGPRVESRVAARVASRVASRMTSRTGPRTNSKHVVAKAHPVHKRR